MSSVSSLADATSSGAGEEMSFISTAHSATGTTAKDDSTLRHQLWMKTSEAKRWQDSVLHLSGIATSKDEALSVERARSAQLALALKDAQAVAAARESDCEQLKRDHRIALQQGASLQSELQTILGTCSGLESQVTQLEHLLQQEREIFGKQGAIQLEKARQEAAAAGKRAEQQEHQISELRARLQSAEAELQVAHSDCVKTLRYAESLHTSTAALAQESQREVDRSHYLQQEVQRLATVCFGQQNQCAQQREIIMSQGLQIQTLEARLGQDGADQLREVLERERAEKDLMRGQLRECLGDYSQVCVQQQLLLSFVEEATVFLRQLVQDLKDGDEQLELVQSEIPLISDLTHKQHAANVAALAAHLEQKQRELDFSLDKQLEYSQELSKLRQDVDASSSIEKLQYRLRESQEQVSEHAAALEEAEEALQQAEEKERKSDKLLVDVGEQLRERSAQLAEAQEAAEILRLQLSELQQRQGEEEEREGQDRTQTSHHPPGSIPLTASQSATSTGTCSRCKGPHADAQQEGEEEEEGGGSERNSEGTREGERPTEMQAAKMRISELEAGNRWLERERERLTELLHASSLPRSPTTASKTPKTSPCPPPKPAHLLQAARRPYNESDGAEQAAVEDEMDGHEVPTRTITVPHVVQDADVEAAMEQAEHGADAAVDALLALKHALQALCRKVQALERQLVVSQKAQYLCEDELQRSCETVEQLRRDLKEALDAQGAHVGGLRGGSVREQASGEAEEEIEEEIEEMICDGLCAAAVDLRRQLEALEQERHRSSILQLHANGSADGEDDHGVATQGSVQGAEGKGDQLGDWPSCGGRCDSAERLRRQLQAAEARGDDAELESEVLQRKLDLCKSELEAVRVKFNVSQDFFSSDS